MVGVARTLILLRLSSCLRYTLSRTFACLHSIQCLPLLKQNSPALTMADSKLANAPSDDEKYATDEKQISTPSSIHDQRTPEAVAAEYGLSEKKLLRKLDLYLVPGVAVSLIANSPTSTKRMRSSNNILSLAAVLALILGSRKRRKRSTGRP